MQKVRVGINGFGRIGRQVFRALHAKYQDKVEVVAINDLFDAETNFHLLEYDTNYGRANLDAVVEGDNATVGDWKIHCFAERDPKLLTWGAYGVDVVVESTGIFRSAKQAHVHIENGAKKVIITAPAKEEDLTIVMGVNHNDYDPAYTNDQRILDLPHKDLRRARAAACNIIPTSTGAAQAVAKVIPSLKGKFTGWSLRVPTPTVSVVDFTAILNKDTDTDTMRAALKEAAEGELKGILAYSDAQLVSMDFKGNPHSSIVEAEYTTVQDGKLAKIVSWYDNEWGYSNRVADLIMWMKEKGF